MPLWHLTKKNRATEHLYYNFMKSWNNNYYGVCLLWKETEQAPLLFVVEIEMEVIFVFFFHNPHLQHLLIICLEKTIRLHWWKRIHMETHWNFPSHKMRKHYSRITYSKGESCILSVIDFSSLNLVLIAFVHWLLEESVFHFQENHFHCFAALYSKVKSLQMLSFRNL